MPPKKNDPFNFDEAFIAAGASGLVKKSMADMKKAAGASASGSNLRGLAPGGENPTSPVMSSSGVPPSKPSSTVQLPPGSLDFLSVGSGGAPAKAAPPKPVNTGMLAAGIADPFGDLGLKATPAPPQRATSGAVNGTSSDPFAMFDDLPGSHTVSAPKPPAPAPAATTSDMNFSGFEDFGVDTSPPKPAAPLAPSNPGSGSAAGNAGSSLVGADSGGSFWASQPPLTSPPTGSGPASIRTTSPATYGRAGSGPIPPVPLSEPPSGSGPLRVPPTTHFPTSRPPPQQHSQTAGSDTSSPAERHAPRPYGFYDEPDNGYTNSGYSNSNAYGTSSGPVPARPTSASAGGGVMGMLRGLGKKAVKAAQTGLQQLESALEKIDGPGHHSRTHSNVHDSAAYDAPQGHRRAASAYAGRSDEPDGEDPAQVALTLLALPTDEREEVLNTLPPRQRQRVRDILAELTEGEARTPLAGGAPTSGVAVDIRTSAVDFSAWEDREPARQPAPAPPREPAAPRPALAVHTAASPQAPLGFTDPPAFADSPTVWQTATAAPPPAPVAAAVHHDDDHDLLGMSGPPAARPPAPAAGPAPGAPSAAVSVHHDDLLGVSGPPSQPPPARAASNAAPAHAPVADVDDAHDFFSGGSAAAAPSVPAPSGFARAASSGVSNARPAAAAGGSARGPTGPASNLMDLSDALHAPDVDVTAHQELYEDDVGHEGEPEIRRQLRAARIAEKHAKMKAALAGKLAAEAEEARQRQEQVELKGQLRAQVDAWKNKNKNNIRGLLSSLQTVLWEDSGWKPVGMGDLLEGGQIRKVWMRANLLVHPDKVRQRNGPPEQVARADMVFDVLTEAWKLFQSTGK